MRFSGLIFISTLFFLFTTCENSKNIKLELNSLFSDHMVLQQKDSVTFWGKSSPFSKINVNTSWGEKSLTESNKKGEWELKILTPSAGGPYVIDVKTSNEKISIKDVLIGEVWLASGQSNMEMDFDYCCNTTDYSEFEMRTADFSLIRMFNVSKNMQSSPINNLDGKWIKAIKDSIVNFSATGYFFAKKLHNELNVPIGIINASLGGTDIEAWTSNEKLKTIDFMDYHLNSYEKLKIGYLESKNWFSQFQPIKLPSDVWYLFLDDPLGLPESWKDIGFKDQKYINSYDLDKTKWRQISIPGIFDNVFLTNDFDGTILFKKTFNIKEINGDYSVEIGETIDMDFTYLNGIKIGSSLGKESRMTKSYKIDKNLLKIGLNTITIRVINQNKVGKIGQINLLNSLGNNQSLNGKWDYIVLAEIYNDLENFKWPYLSFYLYDNDNIDFSKRPNVTNLSPNSKSVLFNAMINPLVPYKIKGTIWYQGENNVVRFNEYETLFPALIEDWREKWDTNFPFYYVQIAPYEDYNGLSSSLREAQRKTLKLEKTGMVVTLDIGETNDIHPSNKHDVGYRLAGLALKNDYNKNITASGPLYKNFEVNGKEIFIDFNSIGTGLLLNSNKVSEFEIAGKNKIYHKAKAKVVGKRISLSSREVVKPMYARYAWSDVSIATLFNKEGLPASSFSTE
jgi:sialate O-acetylesterase